MNKNYDDIINLPHYEPIKHKRMSKEARSAQFAPFAALTGYDDAVKETARLTNKRIELDEDEKQILNDKIRFILENNYLNPVVVFTFFISDNKKTGGKYIEKEGIIKKIDNINGYIILKDKTKIKINDIIEISSDLFKQNINYYEQ